MAKVLITEDYLSDIGDAIRGKLGGSTQYTPGQMASAISSIPTVTPTLISKSIVANGTYNASSDEADGYSDVTVNVPNTYTTSDNGKVVVNQALTAQTSKSINTNGTHDTTANNSVVVDVPNSYAAADEGKVVNNGALVSQGSRTITENGIYDTTLFSELIANISGGGGNVFALLVVTLMDDVVPTVSDGSYTLVPVRHETSPLNKYYYIIPESGEYTVSAQGYSDKTIEADTFFQKYNANYTQIDEIGFMSLEAGDSYSFSGRSGQRVLDDGLFVFTVAKHNSGYISPAFYTLHDYGAVENVISGAYKEKVTYTLSNPDDETETVTLYGYGSFNGGMANASSALTMQDGRIMTIPANNRFFAPYYVNNVNYYNNSPIELKRAFWNMLKATADAE